MEGMAGSGPFGSDGRGGCSFVAGSAAIPSATSVLGADYNSRDYAVVAGCGARCVWQRFIGTVLGAIIGGIVASYFGPYPLVFGVCVCILGLLCAAMRADWSAYRFGGVTLAIVLLTPRTGPAWRIAFDRCAEVSIGIGVALIFACVWPEKEPTLSG